MFIHPGFLNPLICAHLRAAMDRGLSDAAEVVEDQIAERDTVRRARMIEIDPSLLAVVEERLDQARPALEEALGVALGEREGTGFLRYDAGSFYKPHRDRGHVAGWAEAARRRLTVVLFLNDGSDANPGDFEGGELCIYADDPDPLVISPRTGLLLAFPADLLHEVRPVRRGTRDTAIDWFYDRQ